MKRNIPKEPGSALKKLSRYLVVVLIFSFTASIVRNINKVHAIRGQVQKEKEAVEKTRKENEDLAKKVAEVEGMEFLESEVRNKLGLVKPGETVVVLPDAETLAKLAPKFTAEEEFLPDPNWKKWLKLFF